MHATGEWIESFYPLPTILDRPQVLGSALTYARRYSLSAITGIAADEDDDATAAEAAAAPQPRQQARRSKAASDSAKPVEPAGEPLPDDTPEALADLTGTSSPAFTKMLTAINNAPDVSELARMDLWLKGDGQPKFSTNEHTVLAGLMQQRLAELREVA